MDATPLGARTYALLLCIVQWYMLPYFVLIPYHMALRYGA